MWNNYSNLVSLVQYGSRTFSFFGLKCMMQLAKITEDLVFQVKMAPRKKDNMVCASLNHTIRVVFKKLITNNLTF